MIAVSQEAELDMALIEIGLGELGIPFEDEPEIIQRGRKLAEANDPEKTVREIFGYRITPDVRQAFYALEESDRVIAYGGHKLSKTHTVGAAVFGHYWFAQGCPLAEDGRPRGQLLVLMANKDDQVIGTSWKSIRAHAEVAARRGWDLPGRLTVPPIAVGWRADEREPLRWGIKSQGFKAPAKSATSPVLSAEAGLHHPEGVIVWAEEINRMPEAMWETVRGWGPSMVFGAFNPYVAEPGIKEKMDSGRWHVVNFSYLRYGPVLERAASIVQGAPEWEEVEAKIPGGATHIELEEEMRDPARCRPVAEGKSPDPSLGHFLYALPDLGTPEKPGPRVDGVPGHPDAMPKWWAAGELMTAGRLGLFPATSDRLVFSPIVLDQAARRWQELSDPTWSPRVVGVDTAEGGPDRFSEIGNFGRDAVDLWARYQAALGRKLDPLAAVAFAERCPDCEGSGCGRCWNGRSPLYLGRPRSVTKSDDPDVMAERISERYGTAPEYRLDEGGGGYYLRVPLERLGCKAVGIQFGSEGQPVEGHRAYLNQRARMYGVLAMAAVIGAAAIPPGHLGPLEREMVAALGLPEWQLAERKGGTFWRLPDKADIASALSIGSPDPADAAVLTGGIVTTVNKTLRRGKPGFW